MAKLTERDVLTLERIKEKLRHLRSAIQSANSAAVAIIDDGDFPFNGIGADFEVDFLSEELHSVQDQITDALTELDEAIEEYDAN
jgi:hypothetical protein